MEYGVVKDRIAFACRNHRDETGEKRLSQNAVIRKRCFAKASVNFRQSRKKDEDDTGYWSRKIP